MHTQAEVARVVAADPGITPMEIRDQLLYHGRPSNTYAYRLIHRAAAAGLIELRERADKRGCYRCFIPDEL